MALARLAAQSTERLLLVLLLGTLVSGHIPAMGQPLAEDPPNRMSLNESRLYFRHQGPRLTPQEALARFESGDAETSGTDGLNFGLTTDTIWLHVPSEAISRIAGRTLLEVGHASLDDVTLFYRPRHRG